MRWAVSLGLTNFHLAGKRPFIWPPPLRFHHVRDKDVAEVDIVLEQVGKAAGVEVKVAATVTEKDFRGLKKLRKATGERSAAGRVMYDGEAVARFGENLYTFTKTSLFFNPQ